MKLQTIYKSLSVCIITAFLSSCEKDFLDTRVDTAQTEETLNSNYSTLFSLANAPYNYIRNEFTLIDNNLFAPVSDEAVQTATDANVRLFNNGSWNAYNNPDNYYANYYSGIRAANYFIEQSGDYKRRLALNRDIISANGKINYDNDVLNMAWYRAEARILRAFYYFELAKRYGGVPLVTKTLQISDNTRLPKASFDEIINFIASEVDTYKDSLQVNWRTSAFTSNDGRLTKGVALALKGRALLFAASPLHNPTSDLSKWQKAAVALNDVIVFGQTAGNYSLHNDYLNYFLGTNTLTSNETIWAIRYQASNGLERSNYPITTPGGASGITPTHNLVSAYEYKGVPDPLNPYANRDPRLGFTVVTNNSTWNGRTINEAAGGIDDMAKANTSRTGYYLKKFLNANLNLVQNQTAVHNWPLFRYAGVLLEYAEAMNEAYGPDNNNGFSLTARQALNMVRNRPGVAMPAVTVTDQAAFRSAVKHERRVELAFENYRYWDLLRWKDAATVLNQPVTGVSVTSNGTGQFTYTPQVVENRVFDASRMYFYPFPQAEIAKSQGALVQNTGW
ncbi:RagB/SusD family nutrient uptake outer membrane protein [Pedobacter sp. SYSU D00535]|uniref:RagB/SusD family nutrient uptake outer membrane protein n=1 Tax=Pedobacter sp. SYSU D00535 TaxID=2810308 RepID=UPI001A964713|nr:RagB/SusD family nutrient uptake outer membrane protein [Pedobacter sp. SYSU D00535]